jgi:hypothetical protein
MISPFLLIISDLRLFSCGVDGGGGGRRGGWKGRESEEEEKASAREWQGR